MSVVAAEEGRKHGEVGIGAHSGLIAAHSVLATETGIEAVDILTVIVDITAERAQHVHRHLLGITVGGYGAR